MEADSAIVVGGWVSNGRRLGVCRMDLIGMLRCWDFMME